MSNVKNLKLVITSLYRDNQSRRGVEEVLRVLAEKQSR